MFGFFFPSSFCYAFFFQKKVKVRYLAGNTHLLSFFSLVFSSLAVIVDGNDDDDNYDDNGVGLGEGSGELKRGEGKEKKLTRNFSPPHRKNLARLVYRSGCKQRACLIAAASLLLPLAPSQGMSVTACRVGEWSAQLCTY